MTSTLITRVAIVGVVAATARDVSMGEEDELGDRYADALLRQLPVLGDPEVIGPSRRWQTASSSWLTTPPGPGATRRR